MKIELSYHNLNLNAVLAVIILTNNVKNMLDFILVKLLS